MNPFMTAFVVMGVIYALIGIWATVMWLPGSIVICIVGLLICALGWSLSNRLLQ